MNLYKEATISQLPAGSKKWKHPKISIRTFIEDPYYLGIKEETYPKVKDICEEIIRGKYTEAVEVAGIGCEVEGTKILMSDGSIKENTELKVGDFVMGVDGKPRKILDIHKGVADLYDIIPVKGEKKTVTKFHTLSLKRTNKGITQRNGQRDRLAGNIVNITISDYLKQSKKMKGILKLWRTGADFQEKELFIDPYYLGIWLGDGNSHNTGITTQDKEIKEFIYEYAEKWGLHITINKNKVKTCPTYNLNGENGKRNNGLFAELKRLDLLKNKHIPFDYKVNSRRNRLELLAGLLDTDGYLGSSVFEFSNKNKCLCEDVVYLVRSLGLAGYLHNHWNKKYQQMYYRVSISGNIDTIPTRIKRKQAKKRRQKKNVLFTGFKIKKRSKGKYIGFEVDKDNLYLWGDFTVTHNSGKSFSSEILGCYSAHHLLCLEDAHKNYHLGKDKKITLINMGINATQAQETVFTGIRSFIEKSPFFRGFNPKILEGSIEFQKEKILLTSGNSKSTTPLGYNIFFATLDEASFFLDNDNKSNAEEIYLALQRRIVSRFRNEGLLVMISSPRYVGDFIMKKLEESKKNPKIYGVQLPTWKIKSLITQDLQTKFYFNTETGSVEDKKPITKDGVDLIEDKDFKATSKYWEIPGEYKTSFIKNPDKAKRDFGAVPSLTLEAFDRDNQIIDREVNKERESPIDKQGRFKDWFKCDDEEPRYIHIDLGLKKDACGFCMVSPNGIDDTGGESKMKVKVDLMLQIKPPEGGEVRFSNVRQIIYSLEQRGFNIAKVTFDGWQSADSLQILEAKGYEAELLSVDRTIQPYDTLKELLHTGRLDFYEFEPFKKEYIQLELIKGKKVDHPPNGSKDCTDAAAGACYSLIQSEEEESEPEIFSI